MSSRTLSVMAATVSDASSERLGVYRHSDKT
jgi:hypothetical protein